MYKNKNLILYGILVMLVLGITACQPQNRAAIKYRKSQVADDRGKPSKAIRLLDRSAKLDPAKEEKYLAAAAGILFEQNKFEQAFDLLTNAQSDEQNTADNDLLRAEAAAWMGSLSLQLCQRCEAERINFATWDFMELHHIDNDSLRAIILNNKAVAVIYCQGTSTDPVTGELHFKRIHYRDFEQAQGFLTGAVAYDSTNCTAQYNKVLVDAILSISRDHWEMGYLPDTLYPEIGLPYYTCLDPVKKEQSNSFSFKQIEGEMSEAEELVLVLDISGSMQARIVPNNKSGSSIRRVDIMKAACDSLLSNLDAEKTSVGGITIGGSCASMPLLYQPVGSVSPEQLNSYIQQLPLNGATPLDTRVLSAIDLFSKKTNRKRKLLLFSDGIGGCTSYRRNLCALATELAEHNIQFNAFSLLLEQGGTAREYGVLNCIVEETGGMLLGIDEAGQTEDKLIDIKRQPVSIPLFMDEIAAGEPRAFLGQKSLRSKVDSLKKSQ